MAAELARANAIYVRRSSKVMLQAEGRLGGQADTGDSTEHAALNHVAGLAKNLAEVGYAMSPRLVDACKKLSLSEITDLNRCLLDILAKAVGDHQMHRPFYPDFPDQVMAMAEAELYLNALLHYFTEGKYRPPDRVDGDRPDSAKSQPRKLFGIFPLPVAPTQPRPSLSEVTNLKTIDLGSQSDFESIFKQLALANTSLSQQDKEDQIAFIEIYKDDIQTLLPEPKLIASKENRAHLGAALLNSTSLGENFVRKCCTTATDILRLAAALSGGDVSLAEACKFKTFNRSTRRLLLSMLEELGSAGNYIAEDMLRWKKRWIRLGEKLHPGEFKTKFPLSHSAFAVLRNDLPSNTFASKLEAALEHKELEPALSLLKSRPGELARRLDHLMRLAKDEQITSAISQEFALAAEQVSTPVLLQVEHHFRTRQESRSLRVFFPKGQTARAHAMPYNLPPLPEALCLRTASQCRLTLKERFGALAGLGNCFVDPRLADFTVPFSQRSASKSLRTTSRGSRLPLPEGDTLRFFVWWKNGTSRTDIDLSTAIFDSDFGHINTFAYYNLKDVGGCHSGDIVDAPNGASEFIDLSLAKMAQINVRYIAMILTSYSMQPFCDLPECFAGWMSRSKPGSGEVYEPTTVKDKVDLSADTRFCIPAIFDLAQKKVIWCDLSLTNNPHWVNNVAGNLGNIQATLKALAEFSKPNLYDLLKLHAEARGRLVDNKLEADTVFSADTLPFELEKIASEFMSN